MPVHPVHLVLSRLLAVTAAAITLAVASGLPAAAEGVPAPVISIPKGAGETCVADTEVMRRNHMRLLLRQRDETVYQGIHGKFSLTGCVACHAVPGADGKPVSVAEPGQFCRACHDYAAVSIDCFQCHASRPDEKKQAAGVSGSGWARLTGGEWR